MKSEDLSLDSTAHTHDSFFKAVFSQPDLATAFFKSHLPSAICAQVDWATLNGIPGSFVKESLQQVHSDLLFSVRIGERETLLYLLFEHQSTADPTMPLRALGYMTEILIKHHKNHGLPLAPVITYILHQGPEKWNVSTAFEDLFDLSEPIAADILPYLPKFHYALLDLTQCDPGSENTDTRLRAVLQLMKLARQKKLLHFFEWIRNFPSDDFPQDLVGLILLYSAYADRTLDIETIYHTISVNPELKNKAMSSLEKLIEKGRSEGISQGISQGLWVGRIQAFQEFLGAVQTPRENLESMSLAALESLYQDLHSEYGIRFKKT